jgi:wyosine [tRNA(Phe)-imidazoG37] synthetase (radical SAM superfamily)
MRAVESYRTDYPYRAIPEFITEYNTNDGSSEIIGADQFRNLRRMFATDRKNYRIHRHFADNAKVYSVMFIGNGEPTLSTYVWHVPFGADELPIS